MSTTERIAICIPTYNQASYVQRAVESALGQVGVEVEVWVSDDASTDNTSDVMQRLARRHPKVKYHRHARNLGMSGNPNWLLRQPRTEWIVKLDSDDLLESAFSAKLVHEMRRCPQAGYGHAAVTEIDAADRPRRVRRLFRASGYLPPEEALRASVQGYRVAANILMYRRAALESIDFWCRDLSFADDWDMSVRMADKGWGNIYVDAVLARYRVWADAAGYRKGRKSAELRGVYRVFAESLIPAFQRREWATGCLETQRRNIAAGQAHSLRKVPKNSSDYKTITIDLISLGDSLGLRWRLFLVRWGLAWVLESSALVRRQLRDWVKAAYAHTRRKLEM